jgi:outer membrane immunogenic protein
MRKLVASASFLVLSSASVLAADLPMKAPPVVAPIYTWTGFYIGVNGGGGGMNDSNSNTSVAGSSQQADQASTQFGVGPSSVGGNNAFHGTGAIAGGQLGYNYQMGNWVFGVEGEGYWSGMKGTLDASQNTFSGAGGNVLAFTNSVHNQTENRYDFTIAGRMGIAFDRTLVYGKAGWAWGQFDALSNSTVLDFPPIETARTITTQSTWGGMLNGPLFGLGIEYLITNNWTVKLEYNYIMFGTRSFATTTCHSDTLATPTTSCTGNGQSSGNSPLGADKSLFKFGVNYKFDGTLLR